MNLVKIFTADGEDSDVQRKINQWAEKHKANILGITADPHYCRVFVLYSVIEEPVTE